MVFHLFSGRSDRETTGYRDYAGALMLMVSGESPSRELLEKVSTVTVGLRDPQVLPVPSVTPTRAFKTR